jgi:mRNA-degrading endonuclease RelE of RelBE toxin-antitoxin system
MTDDERFAAINIISENPMAGDVIPGSGGARKVRIPKEGKGKRGGYRVVTYYLDEDTPVYLLTVISKGQQSNLTEKQKKRVRDEAKDVKRERR